jgi:putative multiple sugar transport system permease protein
VFLTFVNVGVLAAFSGMIVAARLNSATPKAGVGFELDVIAAVFMGVMNNGMSLMGIGIDYQQVIKGLVLLAAVIFDVYNKSKS